MKWWQFQWDDELKAVTLSHKHTAHTRTRQSDGGTMGQIGEFLWFLILLKRRQHTTTMAIPAATLHAHHHHCVQSNFIETKLSAGPTNSLRYTHPSYTHISFPRHRQQHSANRNTCTAITLLYAQCSLLMHGYWLRTHHQFRYDSVARLPRLSCVIPTLNFLLFSFHFFCFLSFYWHFLDWCVSQRHNAPNTCAALSLVCFCFRFYCALSKTKYYCS